MRKPLPRDNAFKIKMGLRRSAGVEKRNRTIVRGISIEEHTVLIIKNVRDGEMAAT